MKKTFVWILTLALCLSMFAGIAGAEMLTYADTIAWDGEYDVVVAGFGGAGATAASYAADAGAKVLLVEKAPEGAEGGNTRVCGQMFVYGSEDEEATFAYYRQLGSEKEVPEAMLRVYTQQIAHMYDYVAEMFSLDKNDFTSWTGSDMLGGALDKLSPEYPEFEGSDKISLNSMNEAVGDGYLWKNIRKRVTDRADSIDVWFESPAVGLIQDPVSKTILGVEVEREGKTLNIRVKNGVVLATGGFENNPEMVETYLGFAKSTYYGSGYNTGDGIRMAMEVGADLWHMNVYEASTQTGSATMTEGANGVPGMNAVASLTGGSVVTVGADGGRFVREDETARHGHVYANGIWETPHWSEHTFIVYDQAQADQVGSLGDFDAQVIKADTLEELAEKIGVDAAILTETIKRFNGYAETGVDIEYGRAADSMRAFSAEGPYYAIETVPGIVNTQGGPRRNENAEVLDHDGNPIPHLYSAGELGGICSLQYQGGGNIAECLIFGKIAGENAAAQKDETVAELVKAESNIVYTPGAVSDIVKEEAAYETAENEYIGVSENGMGGTLVVKVTMDGDVIAAVEVLEQKETVGIADAALDTLPGTIVAANSTDVDTVSGATITSKAIIEAVDNALSQVK